VLFIDEAYDLDPKSDTNGKPIVSELLDISENKRDSVSIILAGYEDDMNNKLFAYNDGLRSRFEPFHFEDFDPDELKTIWLETLNRRSWSCDATVTSVVTQKLSKMIGKKGFGNARAVVREVKLIFEESI
jgi:replication-associated recombination protein RarA